MTNIILIGILISWLPVGYIGARLWVWAFDNMYVFTMGKRVKTINNDRDRLMFLFGVFGGYITLPFLLLVVSVPIGNWLSEVLFLWVITILHLDKVLPSTGRAILSTARRLSPY